MTHPNVAYALPASKKPKPFKKLPFNQLTKNIPWNNYQAQKGTMYTIEARSKALDTTDREGRQLVSKQDGSPQVRLGVKFQELGDQWFSIYAPVGDPLILRITKGDKLTGQLSGRTFYLNGVESGGQPPSQPVQTTPTTQAPAQAPADRSFSDDERQRLIVIQNTTRSAAIMAAAGRISDIEVDHVGARLADAAIAYAKGNALSADDGVPF